MEPQELIALATDAMERAYAPYSGFQVGAALLSADGQVFLGCNIENAAFSPTVCAERTAFFNAVSQGVLQFSAIAVVGGKHGIPSGEFPPCGVCRQVMREFCEDDFLIHLSDANDVIHTYTLQELLPNSFSAKTHMSNQ